MRTCMRYKKYAVKTFDDNTKLEYIEYFSTKTKAVQAVMRIKADGGKAVLYKFVEKFDKFVQWDMESPIPVLLGRKGNVVIGIDNKCYVVEDV